MKKLGRIFFIGSHTNRSPRFEWVSRPCDLGAFDLRVIFKKIESDCVNDSDKL